MHTNNRGEILRHHLVGKVEDTAPGIGVVWICDDADGHRAILHADEYSIWQIRTAPVEGNLAA